MSEHSAAIPDPQLSVEGLYEPVLALKQAVETLVAQRGARTSAALLWSDLVELGLVEDPENPHFVVPRGSVDEEALDRILDARMDQLNAKSQVSVALALRRRDETVDRLAHQVIGLWARVEEQTQGQLNQTGAKVVRVEETIEEEREVRATLINAVKAALDFNENTGQADAILGLDSRVTANENEITSTSTAILAVKSAVDFNETTGQADAILGLDSRVTANENEISSVSSAVIAVQSDVDDAFDGISGNASAISSLDSRVTTAEGNISSAASQINTLNSSVFHASTGLATKASITSVNTVESNLNTLTGNHNSLATSFNQVFVSNASGNASTMFRAVASAGPSGFDATLNFQARVDTGGSFTQAAMVLDVASGLPSRLRLVADRIVLATGVTAGATVKPLASFSGGLIHFHEDVRMGFASILNVQITNAHIANASIDFAKLTNVEISGSLHILPGTIITGNIALGAVSTANHAVTIGAQTFGSFTVVQSVTLTTTGNSVSLDFNCRANSDDTAANGIEFEIRRGTTSIFTTGELWLTQTESMLISFGFRDGSPGSGSVTYQVRARRTFGAGNLPSATNRFLRAMELKR